MPLLQQGFSFTGPSCLEVYGPNASPPVHASPPVQEILSPLANTLDQGNPSPVVNTSTVATDASDETCACGRRCKGRRGLRAHQRACGLLNNLLHGVQPQTTVEPLGPLQQKDNAPSAQGITQPTVDSPAASPAVDPSTLAARDDTAVGGRDLDRHRSTSPSPPFLPSVAQGPSLKVKPGLKLPKSKERWEEAITYFRLLFSSQISDPIRDLDSSVLSIQEKVYTYFAKNFGVISPKSNVDLEAVYSDLPIKRLKKTLAILKN